MELRSQTIEQMKAIENSKIITGYAVKWNKPSQLITGKTRDKKEIRYKEIFEKGSFKNSLEQIDIRALWNHDTSNVLGRIKPGTLSVEEDEIGLRFELDLPNTTQGNDIYELVKRGDVDGVSFGFKNPKQIWKKNNDGTYLRTISKADLLEISCVTFPAYADSEVCCRSNNINEIVDVDARKKLYLKTFTLGGNMNLKEIRERQLEIRTMLDSEDEINLDELEKELRELAEEETEIEKRSALLEMTKGIENIVIDRNEVEERSIEKQEVDVKLDKNLELRNNLIAGNEVELRTDEVTTGNIGAGLPVDYVSGIVKKVENISPLFALTDKIVTAGNTSITVQGNKLGKFVPMAELQAYANKTMTMDEKTLNAHKYGIYSTLSEEVLEDTAFNVEAEINEQIVEGFALTMDELIVTGDAKVYGIEKATKSGGSNEVSVAATITVQNLLDMYYSLKPQYRTKAVWVVTPEQERQLAGLVDGQGRPMLVAGYGATPTFTVLGRPVVVNEFATRLSFVDLSKAVKVGIRRGLKVKKDTSVGFANDTVAFKGNARLDIIEMLPEAISYGKTATKNK